jgi:hypothetical protein
MQAELESVDVKSQHDREDGLDGNLFSPGQQPRAIQQIALSCAWCISSKLQHRNAQTSNLH